jgi:hypothetical protein
MGNSRGILAERFPDLLSIYKEERATMKDREKGKAWTLL